MNDNYYNYIEAEKKCKEWIREFAANLWLLGVSLIVLAAVFYLQFVIVG